MPAQLCVWCKSLHTASNAYQIFPGNGRPMQTGRPQAFLDPPPHPGNQRRSELVLYWCERTRTPQRPVHEGWKRGERGKTKKRTFPTAMYDVGAHETQRGVNDLRDCQKFSCPATNHRRHRNSNFYIVEATGRQKTRESGRQNLRSSSAPQDHVRKCTASVRTYMRYVHVLCEEEVNSSKGFHEYSTQTAGFVERDR